MTRRRQLASTRRVERASGRLATAATQRMSDELAWFRDLSAEHRSWVGLVAQAGIASFVSWLRQPATEPSRQVFGAAPRELARVVTLQQTVDLVRLVVDVVEHAVPELAAPGEEDALRLEILRFSREIAFSAAQVYALAAEERGAWHARQQALLLDALVRGETADATRPRAAALGWVGPAVATPLVGTAPDGDVEVVVESAQRAVRGLGLDALAGVHGDRLVVVVLGALSDRRARAVAELFGSGPVVVGAGAEELAAAGPALAEVLAGLRVATAWPGAPRPVRAHDLLPERALAGDPTAHTALRELAARLADGGAALVDTVRQYLACGGSVEATARAMYLHPNTVRYRLRRATDITDRSPHDARDAYVLQVALTLTALP
jgi:hypothetical protein